MLFRPTVSQQQTCPTCSTTLLNGDFKVTYDVNRDNACDLLVSLNFWPETYRADRGPCESSLTHLFVFQVANNYFAHFFAPQNLTKLNKNVVFVIDISSSMEGQKVKQVNGGSKQPSGSFFNPIAHPKLALPPETGFGTSVPGQRQGNLTGNPSGQGLWNQPLLTVQP